MSKRCLKCGKEFSPRHSRQLYCSKSCKVGSAVVRARQRKSKIVNDFLGKKCVICGYSTTPRALECHHVEPSEKLFQITGALGTSYGIDRVLEEAQKCVLLCANCHREEQDGIISKAILSEILNNDSARRAEFLRRRAETIIEKSGRSKSGQLCECGHQKSSTAQRCRSCYLKSREKIAWPATKDLLNMLASSSFVAVGRKLGVTDNAVRKRVINHPC